MVLIDRTDIETWGQKFDSKGNFPKLIGKLIYETTPRDTTFHIASGSEVFIGGWDGIVNCSKKIGLVPEGISLWEIGVNGDKQKANEDYSKRTNNSLGFDKRLCTYIFVTTIFWEGKDDWAELKEQENIWKDVKAYDSRNISEWLENSPVSARWFAILWKNFPYEGIYPVEEFWRMITHGPKGMVIHPELVTAGRTIESKMLKDFLTATPGLLAVKASTRDEAIAFIIGSALQFDVESKEIFLSRSLVIDTVPNFHATRINKNGLNIIAKLDDSATTYVGVTNGHHILLPLGPDDHFNSQDLLNLPRIDRDGQINGLISMGFSSEEAAKKSLECGRDFTILKKLLGFPPSKVNLFKIEAPNEFIPTLLIGRWSDRYEGDKLSFHQISGEDYEKYSINIREWLTVEDPPLVKIGEGWRLASPLDAWTRFGRFVSNSNLQKFRATYLEVMGEENPALSLPPDKRKMAGLLGIVSPYSSWLKEGLNQSLILVAVYGQKVDLFLKDKSQEWVDEVINALFKNASGNKWASLDSYLPLIAEAAPVSFMNAVSNSLASDDKHILKMFEEEDSLVAANSRHTGLLWSLEALAWNEEYFHRAVMLLARLSTLDPGGRLLNRPLSSLIQIFIPWHYQTFASLYERILALDEIVKKEKSIGWKLLMNLLPSHHGVSHDTYKMRWRLFDRSFNIDFTYEEKYKTHTQVLNVIIKHFDFSTASLSELIEKSDFLLPNDRNTLVQFVKENHLKVNDTNNLVWYALRRLINQHRQHPDANWALPSSEIEKYYELNDLFEPKDETSKLLLLFNEQWPLPIDDPSQWHKMSYDKQQEMIDQARARKVKEAYANKGLDWLLSVTDLINEHWAFGVSLAEVIDKNEEVEVILNSVRDNGSNSNKTNFIHGFVKRMSFLKGLAKVLNIIRTTSDLTFSHRGLLLLPLSQGMELWDFLDSTNVETRQEYWKNMVPWFWKLPLSERLYGVFKLIESKRYIAALRICYHNPDGLPSSILIDLLKKIALEKNEENQKIDGHEIERIFEELEKRNDVNEKDMVDLEWLYIQFLSSFYSNRKPILLHQKLATDPTFFVEVLKWTYKPEDNRKEFEDLPDSFKEIRADAGYDLFKSWTLIPGSETESKINETELRKWIDSARKLAAEEGRLKVADAIIGKVLAQYPESKDLEIWPPLVIAQVIEDLDTDSLKRNFSAAVFNKRGSSVRGPFDGGRIERDHASYFTQLSKRIRTTHPKTAEILMELAKEYEEQGRRQDEIAEREKLDT